MNFLEAKKILSGFSGGEPLPFLLAMSGTPDPLKLYLEAAAAVRGRSARIRTLPFNTLAQALLSPPAGEHAEVFLLTPWDFVPQADWRSGFPSDPTSAAELRRRADAVCSRLAARAGARFVYVPATLMPLLGTPEENAALDTYVRGLAASLGSTIVSSGSFGFSSYLSSGCPVASSALGSVASAIVDLLLPDPVSGCKVVVTDLDNVMWGGVIAEEGLDGVAFRSEAAGYRHFIYQSFLRQLRNEGVLLAAVSRNDPAVALAPFQSGRMVLQESDFVTIVASYHAKSAQISMLAEQLNLGLDAFLFVDDNPVELAEVSQQLPSVRYVQFPTRDEDLPAALAEIRRHFPRVVVTSEDRERTEMYRRRLAGMVPSEAAGSDLTAFLRDLGMTLTIHDRTRGDRARAVQLINKTNQFNLNGRRVTDEEVGATLAAGGRLFTATLDDRHGTHGEIISCLITPDGTISSLVMSCRVFQRRAEHAFFVWLAGLDAPPRALSFAMTERNEPIRRFLEDESFVIGEDGIVAFDATAFVTQHGSVLDILELRSTIDAELRSPDALSTLTAARS